MRVEIITLFPEMFDALKHGVIGRAQTRELLKLNYWNPRDFTEDNYHRVDDKAYGGGPGMVMMAPPLSAAIKAAKQNVETPAPVFYLSPAGRVFNQSVAQDWVARYPNIILLAGRYEGVDQRLLETEVDEQWSIGDYVLSGGELAAMVVIDTLARLLPGVLGHEDSAAQDSFMNGLLDCPHYTKPEVFAGLSVPKVLKSGNHAAIAEWRLKQSLGQTWKQRPDLLVNRPLSAQEQRLLDEYIDEEKGRSTK